MPRMPLSQPGCREAKVKVWPMCCLAAPRASRSISPDAWHFSGPNTAMPVVFRPDGSVTGALYARGYGLRIKAMTLGLCSRKSQIPQQWSRPGRAACLAPAMSRRPGRCSFADGDAQVHVTTLYSKQSACSRCRRTRCPKELSSPGLGQADGLVEYPAGGEDLRTATAAGGSL